MAPTAEAHRPGIEPDYRPIDPEVEKSLLTDALNSNQEVLQSDSPFALLTISGESPYANVARSLECQVFDHYFNNDPNEMKEEYAPYEDSSSFFLLVDRENTKAAGVMRIIHPGEAGSKSVNDLPTDKCVSSDGMTATQLSADELAQDLQFDPAITLDVATIVAHPEYGAKARQDEVVLSSLMRAVYKYSQINGYDHLVAIIDKVPREKLEAVGLPIRTSDKVASPFEYLGAKGNSFIEIDIPAVEGSVRAVNDGLYDYVFGDQQLGGSTVLSFHEQ